MADKNDHADHARIGAFSVEDVSKYVATELGLPEYAEAFAANHVDGQVLKHMEKGDLKALGIKSVGHRLMVLEAISGLQQAHQVGERNKVLLEFTEHCKFRRGTGDLD